MRKSIFIAAVGLVLLGVMWRFGSQILWWVGHFLGKGALDSSYNAFVEGHARMLMAEGSFAKNFGPWVLMGVGLFLLAALYFLGRKYSEVR